MAIKNAAPTPFPRIETLFPLSLWVMNCNAFRSGSPKGQPAKEFTYDSWLSAMK